MCNAYNFTRAKESLIRLGAVLQQELELPEVALSHRSAPRQMLPIVRLEQGRAVCRLALWFFIPPGAKEPPKYSLTNARDDKLASGWPWKLVSANQRCLVPCDGFFEPDKPSGSKERAPWSYYAMKGGAPFFLAGLWSEAADPRSGEIIETFAVVTTRSNALIYRHDRMPVIPPEAGWARWLTPGPLPKELLKPYPAELMTGWRVADAARNPRSPDSAKLIEPIGKPHTVGEGVE